MQDIAIVGLGALFPGARNVHEYWRHIFHGHNQIREVPGSHWSLADHYDSNPKAADKTYSRTGGFIPPVSFDPLEYGLPPSALTATDSGQILGMVVAKQALDDYLQGRPLTMAREGVAVILGTTGATELIMDLASRLESPKVAKALAGEGLDAATQERVITRFKSQYPEWQEASFPGLLNNVVSGRIAHRFDLRGANFVTDAACASSLAAVKLACDELRLGQADMVLTGGVDTLNTILMYMCFSKTPALSPNHDCRPFDESGDGTIVGEGIGILALRRLDDAVRDGDKIYAVIKGVGAASDGLGKSIYAPKTEGQVESFERAYRQAGFAPESVGLIEAHGTGTKAGDACEIASLKTVFKNADLGSISLTSVKAMIGHTKAAAGAAGLIKATLALHHKVLPPHIKVDNLRSELRHSPFRIDPKARPWVPLTKHPRRAGVSAFGFGGTNFHVVLEEAPCKEAPLRAFHEELFIFSGVSIEELQRELAELQGRAGVDDFSALAAHTQTAWRAGQAVRLAFVATADNLVTRMKEAQERLLAEIRGQSHAVQGASAVFFGTGHAPGKLAVLFPGQGSQVIGMGAHLASHFPAARQIWEQAESAVPGLWAKVHVSSVMEPADVAAKKLAATEWAQPAIATCSAAMFRVLQDFGLHPDYIAGHSLGEICAYWAAGHFDFAHLMRVARKRGELMAAAAGESSGMIAVKAPRDRCAEILRSISSSWVVANVNAPQQTVLSGTLTTRPALIAALRAAELPFTELPVSAAFHSPLMAPVAHALAPTLDVGTWTVAEHVVVSSAEALRPNTPARDAILAGITAPVNFVQTIETLYDQGVRLFLEPGPKSVLSHLTRAILGARPALVLSLEGDALWAPWAQMLAWGVELDMPALGQMFSTPALSVQDAKPKFQVAIAGPNVKSSSYQNQSSEKKGPVPTSSPQSTLVSSQLAQIRKDRPLMDGSRESLHLAWLNVAKEAHMAMLKTHEDFQRQLAQTHQQMLLSSLHAMPAAQNLPVIETVEQPLVALQTAVVVPQTAIAPPVVAPTPVAASVQAMPAPVAPVVAPVANKDFDNAKVLSDVKACVAEMTGYPVDMLQADQSLERDLGIDSIKRVEIFSALSDRYTFLADVDASELNQLETLAHIVGRLERGDQLPT
jgi:polyketide-type polyunsaturated fatty acid synthase PfaA